MTPSSRSRAGRGERQIKKDANIGVAGSFMPVWSTFATFSKTPD